MTEIQEFTTKPSILISELNAPLVFHDAVYLPYIWAILKSYWEHNGSDTAAFTWLDPLYSRETMLHGLDTIYPEPVDVVGLSCYVWNWDLNCEVARWAKRKNPNCLVVAGGPHVDYKDPKFFQRHPYIDIIVLKDGEIPFTRILEAVLQRQQSFQHIPGLCLPADPSSLPPVNGSPAPHIFTGPPELPTLFDYSPYVEQAPLYEHITAARGTRIFYALWETNRGCPYSCNYCGSASAPMSTIRKLDMGRVTADLEFLARIGVTSIYLLDANFGILPRDVEIAELAVSARSRYGFPRDLICTSAKNNPERTAEIVRILFSGKLTNGHWLAVQHTDSAVVAAANRENIPVAQYRNVVKKLMDFGIPCYPQVIVGMPGDTLDKWKDCLGELMDWGAHENFCVFPYQMILGAPSGEPEFRERWNIETISRGQLDTYRLRKKGTLDCPVTSEFLVASRGFSRGDWVEAMTYSTFVQAFHNLSITRLPAIYLRLACGVRYRDFYDAVISEFLSGPSSFATLRQRVLALYSEILRNPDAEAEFGGEEFPDCPFMIHPLKWVFIHSCLRIDEFFHELSPFLQARFPQAEHLGSVLAYQKNLIVTPDYSSKAGRSFAIDRDWPRFFAAAARCPQSATLPPPPAFLLPRMAGVAVQTDPEGKSLDFGDGSTEDRRRRWLIHIVSRVLFTAAGTNLPHPVIRRTSFMQTAKTVCSRAFA